jgi:FkbM family methyltransferase
VTHPFTQPAAIDAAHALDSLLDEPLADARHREQTAFEGALKPFSRRVVIYGAGNLGRRTLAGLRDTGIDVVAFADRNRALRTRLVDGVPVYGPEEVADQFGDNALFVIALWHPTTTGGIESVARQLREFGCQRAIPFVPLYWRYPARYLPYYMWDLPSLAVESKDRVHAAFDLFSRDPDSQRRFVQQLRLRMHADFGCPEPPAKHNAYFPPLFRPIADESFVDCGAYDGDTVEMFRKWTGGSFSKIVAFEPDPKNADALQAFAHSKPDLSRRIEIHRKAAAEQAGLVRFAASGGTDAAISESGDIEIACVALDEALAAQRTTFIKMDIEGAEMSALRGARRVIRRDRPILAVCVYHQQDHLWEVPLTIASELDRTRFALFGYFMEGMETVCYAIPEERFVQ